MSLFCLSQFGSVGFLTHNSYAGCMISPRPYTYPLRSVLYPIFQPIGKKMEKLPNGIPLEFDKTGI